MPIAFWNVTQPPSVWVRKPAGLEGPAWYCGERTVRSPNPLCICFSLGWGGTDPICHPQASMVSKTLVPTSQGKGGRDSGTPSVDFPFLPYSPDFSSANDFPE